MCVLEQPLVVAIAYCQAKDGVFLPCKPLRALLGVNHQIRQRVWLRGGLVRHSTPGSGRLPGLSSSMWHLRAWGGGVKKEKKKDKTRRLLYSQTTVRSPITIGYQQDSHRHVSLSPWLSPQHGWRQDIQRKFSLLGSSCKLS
jgi:hypothetical protein